LLQVHPVLSELMQEDDTGVIECLNGLETQEAVQTQLALESLQDLVKLQTLHMIAEGLGCNPYNYSLVFLFLLLS
jgi:hypothetical protein